MFETITESFEILKRSLNVLMSDKKLLIFPLISGIALLGLLISFIVPSFLVFNSKVLTLIFLAVFYFLSYFIVIFFNCALIYAANKKMEGSDAGVIESISFAFSRIINIVLWSVVAATVGLILSILRDEAGRRGGIMSIFSRIVIGLIGMAWSLATFFVMPAIVIEGLNPWDALKRSVDLIKKTWGETVVGGFGIGIVFFVLYAVGVVALVAMAFLSFELALLSLVLLVPYFILLFLVQSTIHGIFVAALYRYATLGECSIFDQKHLEGAFKQAPAQQTFSGFSGTKPF